MVQTDETLIYSYITAKYDCDMQNIVVKEAVKRGVTIYDIKNILDSHGIDTSAIEPLFGDIKREPKTDESELTDDVILIIMEMYSDDKRLTDIVDDTGFSMYIVKKIIASGIDSGKLKRRKKPPRKMKWQK